MSAEARAAQRGAKLLDQFVPKWYRKISLAKFQIDDPNVCVLGHVYGEFTEGLHELVSDAISAQVKNTPVGKIRTKTGTVAEELYMSDVPELDPFYYGFDIENSENASYERLGQQWVTEIKARRG